MGFLDKVKQAQQQAAGAMSGGMVGGMPGMGDMAGAAAAAQLAQKLRASGVEAPGVINAMRFTGQTDMGGGQEHQVDVTITPQNGSGPYQTTITQSFIPSQLEGLSEGAPITVKYDPDNPSAALIYGW